MPAKKIHEFNAPMELDTFKFNFKAIGKSIEFSFDASDPDLPKRLFEARKIIDEQTKNIGDFKIDADGMPDTDDYIEKANQVNQIIYDAIDYAFGNKVSDELFKYCSPMQYVGDTMYLLYVLDTITPVLQGLAEKKSKKANENMEKYLKKYMPKKR